ncbi:MAG: 50S ribosomal protein L28 [bacterium]
MATKCVTCGKTSSSGYKISHSHHRTKRRFKANLQTVRILVDGVKKKAHVCTRCLRSGKVKKAL